MAHEVGHNLGMFHDFDKRHGGGGNPCDNSGFMSYGPKVYKWSECSVKDFTAKYTLNKHNWCMPGNDFQFYLKIGTLWYLTNINFDRYILQCINEISGLFSCS